MKKTLCILLSAILLLPLCFSAVSAAPELPVVPVYSIDFTVTPTGVNQPYSSPGIYVYTNTTSEEKALASSTYHFSGRLLVFAKDGRLIEAGSGLLETKGCVQETLKIPAGGFAVAFNDGQTKLKNCWDFAMENAMLYNATLSVVREVFGSWNSTKSTLRVYYNNTVSVPAGAKKYLFVGNSCTYVGGNPLKFRALCAAAGVDVTVDYCTKGSSNLTQWADESHEYGKLLRKMLNEKQYDYVVLQDASGASKENTLAAVAKLVPLITAKGASPLFYMRYPDVVPSKEKKYIEQINRFADVYSTLADTYDSVAAPSVVAYKRCGEKYPEINLYADDGQHHSKEGSYLIACTWLYAFTGKDPVGNTYTADLPADTVKKLQEIAKDAVERAFTRIEDGSTVPTFKSSDGKTYGALSIGKSYTRTGTAYTGDYEDTDGKGGYLGKMTDGKLAIVGDDTAIGCFKGNTTTVTIDLGEKCTVKGFFTDLWGGSWGVPLPDNATASVAFSDDGTSFSEEVSLTRNNLGKQGGWTHVTFTADLPTAKTARYVRFTYNIVGGVFCWTSEAVVYGTAGVQPEFALGDVNGDKSVNSYDYQMLKAYVLGTYKSATDAMISRMNINGDKKIDSYDYQMLKAMVLGTYKK